MNEAYSCFAAAADRHQFYGRSPSQSLGSWYVLNTTNLMHYSVSIMVPNNNDGIGAGINLVPCTSFNYPVQNLDYATEDLILAQAGQVVNIVLDDYDARGDCPAAAANLAAAADLLDAMYAALCKIGTYGAAEASIIVERDAQVIRALARRAAGGCRR